MARGADRPVLNYTPFNDLKGTTFTGFYRDSVNKAMYIYLRCKILSKKNDLDEKIDKILAHGTEITDMMKLELAQLLIEAKEQERTKCNQFVVNSIAHPSVDINVLILDCRFDSTLYFTLQNATVNAMLPVERLIIDLQLDKYKGWDTLIERAGIVVSENNKYFKWIDTIDIETAIGTFV